jgi:hypothetical protein
MVRRWPGGAIPRMETSTGARNCPDWDVAALVRAFVHDPFAARFSPRHRIGEQFERRSRHDHLPIARISMLRSPDEVAAELGVPRLAVARLNIDVEPGWVVLPDPEFAPMVAAWLSALVATTDVPAHSGPSSPPRSCYRRRQTRRLSTLSSAVS